MNQHKETQIAVVSAIWLGAVILMAALFIAAGMQGAFTLTHFIFAALILTMAFIGTPLAMRWIGDDDSLAKAKRQRIDDMIRDMSDDELVELKQRLSDGNYDEDELLDYVSEDGELVFRS